MPFAEVAVNAHFPHRDAFTYEVPPGIDVRVGHAVYVPFGRRRLQGVVLEITDTPRFDAGEVRPIEGLIEAEPVLSPAHVELARWLSDAYLAPPFPCAQLMLPPGFDQRPLTLYTALPEDVWRGSANERQRAIWNYLVENGPVEAATATGALREAMTASLDGLVRKGMAARSFELAPSRGRARSVPHVRLAVTAGEADRWLDSLNGARPSRQADLLERLAEAGELPEREARAIGRNALPALIERGIATADNGSITLAVPAGQAHDLALDLRLSAGERAQAEAVRLLIDDGPSLPRSVVRARSGIAMPALRALADAGIVALEEVPLERDPLAGRTYPYRPAPLLTPDQAAALRAIAGALELREPGPFLLHGVTGSGKTEVYLSALERAVALGRRGIVLVPEISLTPQTVQRFAERFPDRVAVLHSGLSLGERFDQWQRIRRGDFDVVVGARQTLFAPQPDLGLIVLDEEHEWTYKQHDALPRYHARDAAERLAQLSGATLVLGSATPDVVTYHRAERGDYRLLELPERVAAHEESNSIATSRPLPDVTVVDLREELRSGNRSIFSAELHEAIERALAQEEQVILFLNRRGSASFLLCRDCGFVPVCPSCGLAYSLHGDIDRLVCHECGRRRGPYAECPECHGTRLRGVGLGTQRLEEETALAFPEARILRWDRDVTRGRGAHERILARFLQRQADILIGTQMIAKGLDLPYVTLVGVVAADIGLHVPDFRSGERTFQVLSQVAGRAGRGPLGGRVIIQSYAPDHYAIEAASRHDYHAMYTQEMTWRRELGYPPFGRLAQLSYTARGERRSLDAAAHVAAQLQEEVRRRGEPGAWVRGPAPAFVPRRRGAYRWNVILRAPDPPDILRDFTLGEGWEVDIDPVSLA